MYVYKVNPRRRVVTCSIKMSVETHTFSVCCVWCSATESDYRPVAEATPAAVSPRLMQRMVEYVKDKG